MSEKLINRMLEIKSVNYQNKGNIHCFSVRIGCDHNTIFSSSILTEPVESYHNDYHNKSLLIGFSAAQNTDSSLQYIIDTISKEQIDAMIGCLQKVKELL